MNIHARTHSFPRTAMTIVGTFDHSKTLDGRFANPLLPIAREASEGVESFWIARAG